MECFIFNTGVLFQNLLGVHKGFGFIRKGHGNGAHDEGMRIPFTCTISMEFVSISNALSSLHFNNIKLRLMHNTGVL